MNFKQQLLEFFLNEGIDTDKILEDTQLFEKGYLGSLALINLICFVENTFGAKISPTELSFDNFGTLNQIEAFIQSKSN